METLLKSRIRWIFGCLISRKVRTFNWKCPLSVIPGQHSWSYGSQDSLNLTSPDGFTKCIHIYTYIDLYQDPTRWPKWRGAQMMREPRIGKLAKHGRILWCYAGKKWRFSCIMFRRSQTIVYSGPGSSPIYKEWWDDWNHHCLREKRGPLILPSQATSLANLFAYFASSFDVTFGTCSKLPEICQHSLSNS